jgi:citrate synthase
MAMPNVEVARGLEGVVSHATELAEVDGQAGRLTIRGYDITELSGKVSFEEAAYLLWYGELPNRSQLDELQREMAAARILPSATMDVLKGAARSASGMHALRMGAATLSVDDADVDDLDLEANRLRAIRLTAQVASVVAHQYRLHQGQEIAEPPAHLGFAASYLYMLTGKEPDPAWVEGLDAYLVAVSEHGMNASTFAARVIAGTDSDMVSAVTGAVGALKGPKHGGVPGPVLDMLEDIGTPDKAEQWIRDAMNRGDRIMGFGHRVYKVRDPRAEVLTYAAEKMAQKTGDHRLLDLAAEVERTTVKVLGELKPGRDLYANVELFAALVLHAIDIPSEIFTPTFAVGRMSGWTAHILEQYADNRLIRPQSIYVGPKDRRWVPVGER